jgi:hypothetical protein
MSVFRFLLIFALAGCASISDPVVVCPVHVQPWSADEQYRAFQAEDKLPANSILVEFLKDYATMRDEARSCDQ